MSKFIRLSYKGEDVSGYINVDKIYEIAALKEGGTKIILNIADKKGWSIYVNESVDEVMDKMDCVLLKD